MQALPDECVSPKVAQLFLKLNSDDIAYCHWKSNYGLPEALRGNTDLDLLVSRESRRAFATILAEMDFRIAVGPTWDTHPSIQHFYGFDDKTGSIVHLHVYYRLVTGGALLKNYRLPLEPLLLQHVRHIENVRVPSKAAELLVFVVRKMLEHVSCVEYLFLQREYPHVQKEILWLYDTAMDEEITRLLQEYLPQLDAELFQDCLKALLAKSSFRHRMSLGRRMGFALRPYAILPAWQATLRRSYRFVRKAYQRFVVKKPRYFMPHGGVVISFVGAEAVGKSTLVAAIAEWLGRQFAVQVIHAGKPPSTWITALPNVLMPLLRYLLPRVRTNTVEIETNNPGNTLSKREKRLSLLYVVRSMLIALDQQRLLVAAYRKASKGYILISDRYPAAVLGGMDGPRVDPARFDQRVSLKRVCAQREQRLYRSIPHPDLVFFIRVPVEMAVHRNAMRKKKGPAESEQYVRERHALIERWHIPQVPIVHIDNTHPLAETLLHIKRAIWDIV